jgi:predicted transport protein
MFLLMMLLGIEIAFRSEKFLHNILLRKGKNILRELIKILFSRIDSPKTLKQQKNKKNIGKPSNTEHKIKSIHLENTREGATLMIVNKKTHKTKQ